MQDSMKAGFMDAAGVDPDQMKTVILAIVVCVILLIAAWLGKQVLDAYGHGSIDSNEVVRILLALVIVIVVALFFVSIF